MKKKDLIKNSIKKESDSKVKLAFSLLRGSKRFFVLGIIFVFLSAVIDMVIPQIIKVTIDNVLAENPSSLPPFLLNIINSVGGLEFLKKNLWVMAVAIVSVALFKVVSEYFSTVFNSKGCETLAKTTRDKLFLHISLLPYSWYKKNRTGDIIQRCTSDVTTVNDFLSNQFNYLARVVVLLVLSVVFMTKMHPLLALIALGIFPVIILNSILFDKKIENDFNAYDEDESKVSAFLQENLTGARVVRAFGCEKSQDEKFKKANHHFTMLGKQAGKTYSYFSGISNILLGIQMMIVIVFGAVFCVQGSMTSGEYIAFIAYNGMLAWPLSTLGIAITDLGKANVSLGRINYVLKSPLESHGEKHEKPSLNGDISFENVSFSYDDGEAEILKDVSFTVKSGTTLGILGGTGSGKTTLMMLLDKMYLLPSKNGKITIDGVDINDIDTHYLRKNIGMVLQDPFLFSRTIGENIGILKENISERQIREATMASSLVDTIDSFKYGYNTFVGERGVTLSGGQKQRVAIARILTENFPIMVFDDSLSAVDSQTDAKIREAIEKLYGSATIIIISHNTNTLKNADNIIVLENGVCTEQGSHQQLIKSDGLYSEIYKIQNGEGLND